MGGRGPAEGLTVIWLLDTSSSRSVVHVPMSSGRGPVRLLDASPRAFSCTRQLRELGNSCGWAKQPRACVRAGACALPLARVQACGQLPRSGRHVCAGRGGVGRWAGACAHVPHMRALCRWRGCRHVGSGCSTQGGPAPAPAPALQHCSSLERVNASCP